MVKLELPCWLPTCLGLTVATCAMLGRVVNRMRAKAVKARKIDNLFMENSFKLMGQKYIFYGKLQKFS